MAGLTGTVRVTAQRDSGAEARPSVLVGLQRDHPGLRLELSLSDSVQDLLARESDIAVRGFRPDQAQLAV